MPLKHKLGSRSHNFSVQNTEFKFWSAWLQSLCIYHFLSPFNVNKCTTKIVKLLYKTKRKFGYTQYFLSRAQLALIEDKSVQSLSRVRLFATQRSTAHQASLSITNSRIHPNPCPLSQWCHPTISSSVVLFSCPSMFYSSNNFLVLDEILNY